MKNKGRVLSTGSKRRQIFSLIPARGMQAYCSSQRWRQRLRLMFWRILTLLILLLAALHGSALEAPTDPNQPTPAISTQQGPTDPQELEAFLDPFFTEQMERLHVP